VNCRYCFRRHFPYADETAAAGQWREAVEYLRADASIHEVILSGGDPLSLTTPKLALLTDALKTLPQLKRLRLHTRLPVVLPERVDAELLKWLSELPWPVTMVIHANHGNELGSDVGDALLQLRQTGTTLLNQSVLLAGVNDNANVLQSLSEALHQHGVLPYYLHQLDRVQGAGHFSVPDADAIALHRELMAALPGYLVPKLVREMAGEPNKSPLYESAIVF
jgi:EF-P beta-lysylation protein EpmB